MSEALYHKFKQHPDLMKELLSTGDAELIEVMLPSETNAQPLIERIGFACGFVLGCRSKWGWQERTGESVDETAKPFSRLTLKFLIG